MFLVYYFARASVMLFVLRLLPSYKKWQRNFVNMAFLLNFLTTAYTCVAYGVSCMPFEANWKDIPGSWCMSTDVVALTNQLNACKHLNLSRLSDR